MMDTPSRNWDTSPQRAYESPRPPKIVALGGGHGLYASLQALRLLTPYITAVVTVADDGGSSGRLRKEFGVLPPGDLRMALSALCEETGWGTTWRDVLQHRFSTPGPLDGHALGNLLIVALWEQLGNTVEALDWVGRLLGIRGRVLPMASVPLEIAADIRYDGGEGESPLLQHVRGQVAVASTQGHVERITLIPDNPPIEDAVRSAIDEADWIIFGPGSWFTSVIPHLMVPELEKAIRESHAKKLLVLNIVAEKETRGLSAADHLESFHSHAPYLHVDNIIADKSLFSGAESLEQATRAAHVLGGQLSVREVKMKNSSARHDPLLLAAAFRDVCFL